MSVSDIVVSSKPGVSMSITRRPSILQLEYETSEVQEISISPTALFSPLARLINCVPYRYYYSYLSPAETYGRLPGTCSTHYSKNLLYRIEPVVTPVITKGRVLTL